MINKWDKFFESKVNDIEKFKKEFNLIRETFYDFEDMGNISYRFYKLITHGKKNDIKSISSLPATMLNPFNVEFYFKPNKNILDTIPLLRDNPRKIRVRADIIVPIKDFCLEQEGIKLLNTILESGDRLSDIGYNVKLNLEQRCSEFANTSNHKTIGCVIDYIDLDS